MATVLNLKNWLLSNPTLAQRQIIHRHLIVIVAVVAVIAVVAVVAAAAEAEAAEVAAVSKLILSTDNRTGIKSYTIP